MGYNIDIQVPISFKDGQILCQVNGQTIDLMLLDTQEEFRTVLWALASQAFTSMAPVAKPKPQVKPTEPDLTQHEQKIGAEFQRQHDEARAKLQQQVKERLGDAAATVNESAFGTAGDK